MAGGGLARGQMGDCYPAGPAPLVHRALQYVAAQVQAPGVDLQLVARKSATWSPSAASRAEAALWEVDGTRVPVGGAG